MNSLINHAETGKAQTSEGVSQGVAREGGQEAQGAHQQKEL